MATVKVKLHPSRDGGEKGVICYHITHNRKTRCIKTELCVYTHEWDDVKRGVVSSVYSRMVIRNRIKSDLSRISGIISDLDKSFLEYSVMDVVHRFKSSCSGLSIIEYMCTLIDQMHSANRHGTAANYEKVLSSLREFFGGQQLSLYELTEHVIANYNIFLIQRGLVRNSVSFYMRVLRAVYNKAVRQRLVEQRYPFMDVYTGVDVTRKRAVPESVIAQLYRLELPDRSPLALTRDMFIFSYCARGMAFVDMAYLTRDNICGDYISYARRKTGQRLSVKIEPLIRRIIDNYTDAASPYIFPLLTTVDTFESYNQYRIALNMYNRLLGRLSAMVDCDCKLTSYTSRHSWATAARRHNVPIAVISQGMGHASEHTTQIYLATLENSVIDNANKDIIGYIK